MTHEHTTLDPTCARCVQEAATEAFRGAAGEPEKVTCPACGNSFDPAAGAVRVTESWDEQAHPRAATGTDTGGQFANGGGASKGKAPAQKGKAAPAKGKARLAGRGPLGYNGKTGTGYNSPNGDSRVHKLQQALNRLGITDSKGARLKDDGKLGPLTTSAVKKAQRQLGVKADGRVTPELLRKLVSAKKLERPKPAKAKAKAKAAPKRTPAKTTPKAVPKMVTISRREAVEAMVNGAMSFDDIREAVRKALSARAREESTDEYGPWVMVADLTASDVVYAAGSDELHQCSYSITEGGEVTLGDPEKVVRTYAPEPAAVDDGSASGTVTEASDRIYGRVIEAKGDAADGGRVFRVRIIAYGDSKNGRRYSESVMSRAAHLYEGARAYDHHRSDEEMRSSTINGMVGSYRNVEAEGDGVYANLHLLPSASHAAEALDATIAAQEAGLPPLLGVSHDVMGHYKPVTTGGRRLQEATAIVKVNSADLVADPAAGGQATRMVAGGTDGTGTEPAEEKEGTVPTKEEILAAFAEATDEELEAVGLARASEAIDEGERETEAAQPKTGWMVKSMIRQKVTDAGLPEKFIESLTAQLPDQVVESDVDARIATLKDVYAEIERGGLTPSAGQVTVTQEAHDKKVKALDAMFAGDYANGYRSFKEAFADVTGKRPKTFDEDFNRSVLQESIGAQGGFDSATRSTESLTTASWAEILGDSVTRRMVAEYAHPSLSTWRNIVSSVVPVADFRTQRIDRLGGYGVLPAVAAGAPYQPLTSPGDEEATYAITKRGGTEDLTLEMIANDDLRAIAKIPSKLGLAAAQTLYRFVWDILPTNAAVTYDSTALFHANHSNTTAVALSQSNLSALRTKMRQQTAYGDTSDVLSIVPLYLVVPSALEELAFQLCTSAVAMPSGAPVGAASDIPNIHQGMKPIVVDYYSDANDWHVVCDPSMCPTIEVGFYQGREAPELFTQSDPSVGSMFNADTLTYKVRHIYSGAVLDHRGFQRGTQ